MAAIRASDAPGQSTTPMPFPETESDSEGASWDAFPAPSPLSVRIRSQYLVLPPACALAGLALGLSRGGREAGHRFLAENAHRPPTTLRGWYLYKKTKNYRMLWGGLQAGGREALKLGAVGMAWAVGEDGMERVGLGEVKELGAGTGTGALFAAVYRLPWRTARKVVLLGTGVGVVVNAIGRSRTWLARTATVSDASGTTATATATVSKAGGVVEPPTSS